MKLSPTLAADLVEFVAGQTGRVRITITGKSMEPALRAGMVVDVEPIAETPRIGDILVFRSQNGLIAHRLIASSRSPSRDRFDEDCIAGFLTCGDANPAHPEFVPRSLVIGRVTAVWTSPAANARRLDGRRLQFLGFVTAHTHAVRSDLAKVRAYICDLIDFVRKPAPTGFRVLMAATHRFEHGYYHDGVDLLAAAPENLIIDLARRHHVSGLMCRWLEDASKSGVDVPARLQEALRRVRWTNALQASRVLCCVSDVRDRFVDAQIPHIFLKGGARLAAGAPGADLQFSGDVDVLVPSDLADRAMATLREGGYRDVASASRPRYANHHHREPLCSPHVDVPVEVHVALAPPRAVSQHINFTTLRSLHRQVDGPVGRVSILDDLGSAIHLAYHARTFRVWRDVILLSRLLRGFDSETRVRFDAIIAGEQRDGLRLRSVVRAADLLLAQSTDLMTRERGYLAWAMLREDLPHRIRTSGLVDAFFGRYPVSAGNPGANTSTVVRDCLQFAALLPWVALVLFFRRSTTDSPSFRRTDYLATSAPL